mmetsp:Transcript_3727/g.13952  ORF Transcript_3727/g.13952 Transcript_3727/m.13952 type:complete len:234 (+) Transcript_3727:1600-2301(+)
MCREGSGNRPGRRRCRDQGVRGFSRRLGHRVRSDANPAFDPRQRRETRAARAARGHGGRGAAQVRGGGRGARVQGPRRRGASRRRAEGLHRRSPRYHPRLRRPGASPAHQLLVGAREDVRHRRTERHRQDDAAEPRRGEGHRGLPPRRIRLLHPARDSQRKGGDHRRLHGPDGSRGRQPRDRGEHPEGGWLRRREDGGDDPVALRRVEDEAGHREGDALGRRGPAPRRAHQPP